MGDADAEGISPARADFGVVVEDRGHTPTFSLPADWSCEQHSLADLNVTVVAPVPGTAAAHAAYGLPLMTFHDVGLNAATCFASFFAYAHRGGACPVLYNATGHYHVTAPGHGLGAPDLPPESSYLTFEELAQRVRKVVEHFKLKRVIGLGVGAGASVLVHAALELKREFAGLILVSPLFEASGYIERGLALINMPYLRGLGVGPRDKDRFLARWLAPETIETNHDLVAALDENLDRVNVKNVVMFMHAESWRSGLRQRLSSLQSKVLLFTGRESPLRFHTADCYSIIDPSRVSWIDITGGGSLVLEEFPDRVATGISLFLQGFGMYEPGVPQTARV
jgi:pimeloyl-ACP methyl ester carboxylesterase